MANVLLLTSHACKHKLCKYRKVWFGSTFSEMPCRETSLMACALNQGFDQKAHSHNLIKVFISLKWHLWSLCLRLLKLFHASPMSMTLVCIINTKVPENLTVLLPSKAEYKIYPANKYIYWQDKSHAQLIWATKVYDLELYPIQTGVNILYQKPQVHRLTGVFNGQNV